MTSFDFHLPTKMIFGRGRIAELGTNVPGRGGKIFIVTDAVIARKTSALEKVRAALAGKEIRVFDRVEENPSIATVEEAAREARDFGAGSVLGLGGGSPMDAAKGVAILAANPVRLNEILEGKPLANPPLPVIAVPTTSGTGSEVTPFAVFTDKAAGQKRGFSHPGIFPHVALIDPELTYSMPEKVIVDTGLDVLAHAVEAYLSTVSFPLNDALALHAIDVVREELERAAGKDYEAMDRMAAAASVAGVAIAHASTILPHIMGYPLTVYHNVPHGRASAIMLVWVLSALGEKSACPEKVKAIEEKFEAFGGLSGYLGRFGVSIKLSDYGVREDEIPLYAEKTICKGDCRITPADITIEYLERIFRSAL